MRDYIRLSEQDLQDVRIMAYANSNPLHNSTQTKPCTDPMACLLCSQAARLAVQHYRSIIEQRVIKSIMEEYDVQYDRPHPGDD